MNIFYYYNIYLKRVTSNDNDLITTTNRLRVNLPEYGKPLYPPLRKHLRYIRRFGALAVNNNKGSSCLGYYFFSVGVFLWFCAKHVLVSNITICPSPVEILRPSAYRESSNRLHARAVTSACRQPRVKNIVVVS